VAVGGTGVGVVGGRGVSVGGTGVGVTVGGRGVSVGGTGMGVAVGGTITTAVEVGGRGVGVGLGVGAATVNVAVAVATVAGGGIGAGPRTLPMTTIPTTTTSNAADPMATARQGKGFVGGAMGFARDGATAFCNSANSAVSP
jgi:hypothetical protein